MSSLDIHDLRRKVLAAREFSLVIDGVSFTLRVPSEHQVQVASLRSGLGSGERHEQGAALLLLRRRLLEEALIGWAGAKVSHLVPGYEPDEALDFDPDAVPLLLDVQGGWAQQLDEALVMRLAERHKPQDTAEKN